MASIIECVTLDCADPRRLSGFWAAALGYEVREDEGDWIVLRPADGSGLLLGFQKVPEPKIQKLRAHLDLRAVGATMEAEVGRLEGLGARALQVYENAGESHTVMQDPEGNEFCVVEP